MKKTLILFLLLALFVLSLPVSQVQAREYASYKQEQNALFPWLKNLYADDSPTGNVSSTLDANPTGRKVLLPVTQFVQERNNTCAPACAKMILASRGILVTESDLAYEMGTSGDFGTYNANAIAVLNRYLAAYGVPSRYDLITVNSADPTSNDMLLFKQRLIMDIDAGFPMYLTFDMSVIYPGRRGEHSVALVGYALTEDGQDVAAVYFIDPFPTTQGLKVISPEELLRGVLPCVEPNYAW